MTITTPDADTSYVLLSRQLRDRLKLRAAMERRTMRALLEEIVEEATRELAPALAAKAAGQRKTRANR